MKKVLKWAGIILLAIIVVALSSAFMMKSKFNKQRARIVQQEVAMIPILTDSASLERGALLAVECRNCHGNDYSGADFINDPSLGYVPGPNITPGKGSSTENYTDLDWIRTLRHGLSPEGRPLLIMPSESFGQFDDEDLGSLIGYFKTIKPVEKSLNPISFTFLGSVLAGSGQLGNLFPFDVIAHDTIASVSAPDISADPAYGAYFTKYGGCDFCHGKNFAGGRIAEPGAPPSANITSAGNLGKWSLEQ